MRIGIIGGTGREGRGLALRWARAGHAVVIGSRDGQRARSRAAELTQLAAGGPPITGGDNAEAASGGEVVLLAVPYPAHDDTLRELRQPLQGRILVDITVPLHLPDVHHVHLPPGGAAALQAAALLEPTTRVVAALHHISSSHLGDPERAIDSDVLVCGDDEPARETVIRLIADLGLRAIDAGPLLNAVALESLTPVLLHINLTYKTRCGIRITNLP